MTTFGIIGAGNIGTAIATAVIGLGHDVVIANSRTPDTLRDLIAQLGPKARAATAHEAAEAAEVAVVTVPLKAIDAIPVQPLAGKIVLDTDNYYWERDGRFPALDAGEATTSGLLQAHLPTSKVVKAFNHIGAGEITTTGLPAGDPNRRALVASSDDEAALRLVTELYDQLGFDTVAIVPLSESWRVERDRPAYGVRQTKAELEANLAKAPRTI